MHRPLQDAYARLQADLIALASRIAEGGGRHASGAAVRVDASAADASRAPGYRGHQVGGLSEGAPVPAALMAWTVNRLAGGVFTSALAAADWTAETTVATNPPALIW